MSNIIYLDHNATTPIEQGVFEKMEPYLRGDFGNPSCAHPLGWDAKGAVEEAREKVAGLLGCSSTEIVFTSGGTESNNLAIRGLADRAERPGTVVTTAIEHPAATQPCAFLGSRGWVIKRAGVDSDGVVIIDEILRAIEPGTTLVTVMHSNNETGSIQPISKIAERAGELGVPMHTDAAQSAGKVALDVNSLGVDLMSVAGHKLYAPKGVGALFVRKGTVIDPLVRGAGQEGGIRPGTENVAFIVALGAACEMATKDLEVEAKRVRGLRDELWDLLEAGVPGLRLNGHLTERLPNTLNVQFPGVSGNRLLGKCHDIAASTGAACHEGGEETPSSVLLAMGIPEDEALGAVRLTLGRSSTEAQIHHAARTLIAGFSDVANV